MTTMTTTNGKILVEPYVSDGAIQSSIKGGFATVKQKSTLVGLKAVTNGTIYYRNSDAAEYVERGDVVYFKEEDLHNGPWAKTVFDCEDIKDKFIVAESSMVVMVKKHGN